MHTLILTALSFGVALAFYIKGEELLFETLVIFLLTLITLTVSTRDK